MHPKRLGSRKSQRFMCLSMVSSLLQGFIVRGEYSSFISNGYLKNGAAESSSVFTLVHMAFQPFQKSKVVHIAGSDTQNGCNQVFIFIGHHNIVDVQKY